MSNEILFSSITCEIEGLSQWYANSDPSSYLISWDSYTLEINQACAVQIKASSPHPLSDFRRLIEYFRKWLNFALNMPLNLLMIRGQLASSGEWVDIALSDPQHRDNQTSIQPVFVCADVAAYGVEGYLTRWFNLCINSGRALETYFGSFEATGISYPIRLLLIVQSLEIFHVDFVAERVPQRYNSRQRLRTPKLTHTGKTSRIGSLEERLWDLAESYLKDYEAIIQRIYPNLALFMARVVDTRNFYAHGDRSHEYVVHDETEFEALIRSARGFAFLCWMRALDAPPALVWDIVTSFNNQRRFAPYH